MTAQTKSLPSIQPQQLSELRRRGEPVELIDVRTPVEFREVHIPGARNVPLDSFDPQQVLSSREGADDAPLYVLCRTGNRARQAGEKLLAAGMENVVNVEGGTEAWEAAGLPVERGKKAISLERQVRIVAGFLVLVGAVLAMVVHPYFAALSAFIGAGLMFAGITDTCGMAMMLAKMPWNQVKPSSTSQSSGNSPACPTP